MSYLKDASARVDSDGTYWLMIQDGDLHAVFALSHKEEGNEDSIERRCLAGWLKAQDQQNGGREKEPE